MELLDRYLQAVKFWLPKKQQDDIIRELSANLSSEMEDKAEELGHPLTLDEQSAVLKQHGHPLMVASRYWSQNYLIGPTLFPIYLWTLKGSLAIFFVVYAIVVVAAMAGGKDPVGEAIGGLVRLPGAALPAIAWITLAFVAGEFVINRFHVLDKTKCDWNPKSLPPVVKPSQQKPLKLATVIATTVFGIFGLAILKAPNLMFGPAGIFLAFGPGILSFFSVFAARFVAGVAADWVALLRPEWTLFRSTAQLALRGVDIVIIYFLSKVGNWIVLTEQAQPREQWAAGVSIANLCIYLALRTSLVILSLVFAWECWKYLRGIMRREEHTVASNAASCR